MDSFFQTIGAVIFFAWIAGHLDIIDFHLCIEQVGQCATHQPTKEK